MTKRQNRSEEATPVPDRLASVKPLAASLAASIVKAYGVPTAPDDELVKWWTDTAREDINQAAGKIREYGGDGPAEDLIAIGEEILRMRGQNLVDQGAAQEAGIYFYLRGKIGRWATAIREGRQVSDDTLLDIAFYAMMARRVRAVGAWPWPAKDDPEVESGRAGTEVAAMGATINATRKAQGLPVWPPTPWHYDRLAVPERSSDFHGEWCGSSAWHREHIWPAETDHDRGARPPKWCQGFWNKALAVHGHIYCQTAYDDVIHVAHYHGDPADPALCPGKESETTTS
jgi:hypothetical protein